MDTLETLDNLMMTGYTGLAKTYQIIFGSSKQNLATTLYAATTACFTYSSINSYNLNASGAVFDMGMGIGSLFMAFDTTQRINEDSSRPVPIIETPIFKLVNLYLFAKGIYLTTLGGAGLIFDKESGTNMYLPGLMRGLAHLTLSSAIYIDRAKVEPPKEKKVLSVAENKV